MPDSTQPSCCQRCCSWLGSPSCLIYVNFFLSSWGDWMWVFAAGLYLVHFNNGELLLAAIFGFIGGGAVLLFGGIIGHWVDKTARLRVVRRSLVAQNLFVALSAANVWVLLSMPEEMMSRYGGALWYVCIVAVMVAGVLAQLASIGYKVAIEKDWIVVIAGKDKSQLSNLNASIRAIDLTCKVLSPVVAGIVMTYGSLRLSALMVAGWNVTSVFIEYALLSWIYRKVPRLAVKLDSGSNTVKDGKEQEEQETEQPLSQAADQIADHAMGDAAQDKVAAADSQGLSESSSMPVNSEKTETAQPIDEPQSCLRTVFEPLIVLGRGWRVYVRHKVFCAGLALALLYMTVLGFDSITTGYIYSNGVSEVVVGISMSLAGVTGLLGTVLFTRLRKRLGLERTGLIAYSLEVSCLLLCVASVWLPGSVFDPLGTGLPSLAANCTTTYNMTDTVNLDDSVVMTTVYIETSESSVLLANTTSSSCVQDKGVNISIIFFLAGIISSRVGLWMADLVVTQIMQENVAEKERGVVGGVQNSLNMLFDLVKFVLVICVPHIHMFGVLIVLSFVFIVAAMVSFSYYSFTVRGHLLPHCGHNKPPPSAERVPMA